MKAIFYILLFFSLSIKAQGGYSPEVLKQNLADLQVDLSVGNACDSAFALIDLPGDLDMNNYSIEIMHVHLVVQGNIINEGTFIYNCDTSILEVFGGTLSTPDNDMDNLKIYPNPVIDEINIKGINVTSLELYDIYGRLLKNYKTFGQLHKIMVSDLAAGVYFLRVNDTVTKKIVKR